MRITTYRTELDANKHNILIKEKSCNYPIEKITTSDEVVTLLNDIFNLNKQAEEYVYMIGLASNGRILGAFEISHGTVNFALLNPREIFIKALLCGAVNIIIAHNHPSGDCTPSKNDIESYKTIKEAGEIIGIKVLDNIIIGEDTYYSFRKNEDLQKLD